MKLAEFMLIASPDDLSLLKQWRDKAAQYDILINPSLWPHIDMTVKARNWDLLEQLPEGAILEHFLDNLDWQVAIKRDGISPLRYSGETPAEALNAYWEAKK